MALRYPSPTSNHVGIRRDPSGIRFGGDRAGPGVRACLAALAIALLPLAASGDWEDDITRCNQDPRCRAAVAKAEREEAEQIRNYEAKSPQEKLVLALEALGVVGVIIVIYSIAFGRGHRPKDPK